MTTTLTSALESLYQEEIQLGYIEPARLKDNLYFSFEDSKYNVIFKAQVNYLRDHYIQDMANRQKPAGLDCPICYENINAPGKETLRVHELKLANQDYFAQYSPYPLFPYHTVVISKQHYPMTMRRQCVIDLVDFVNQAPEYTCCSNSDVQWAGASILQHHHYQIFKDLTLPIQTAHAAFEQLNTDYTLELLNYPIACARLSSCNSNTLIKIGGDLIENWKSQRKKNSCNLLLDKNHGTYHLYILFRHPDFRTPIPIQKVKSEGIGVVEVCGYGIYPVPHGDNSNMIWDKINNDGLSVIKHLISGNSPIAEADYAEFWQQLQVRFGS
ncbi:MAG: DUF4922 domain-containing protein [Coxiellaceae bacterium]|nr:DUF4922 domain-containing protein [Coxiellaceae bacterium]